MKVKYNELEKTIEIKDDLKFHYFVMKLIMILNLINAALNLFLIREAEFEIKEIIWLFLGIISFVILYNFIFIKTTLEVIPLDNIKELKEKSFFGRKQYFIELNNGRKRYLNELKTQEEYLELKKLFSKIGII